MLACSAVWGCSANVSKTVAPVDFDRPVPASEPRASLELVLELHSASDCEERFDLALYRDRGVELVAWDDNVGSCSARTVEIRYLTAKLNEQQLMALAKEHAKAATRRAAIATEKSK